MKTFLKVREVVDLYGIGKDTIYKAIHERKLKAYRPNCRDFLIKVSKLEECPEQAGKIFLKKCFKSNLVL